MTNARTQRGLTLIEMLVALSVFAALSGVTVGLISLVGGSDQRITTVGEDISSLERARAILRADLIQAVPRPYREPYAAKATAPFLGGPGGAVQLDTTDGERVLMAFVRDGWINPAASEPRSSLQRVAYIVRDEQLIRRIRPYVDAAPGTPTRDQVVLDGVADIEIMFAAPSQWTEDWLSEAAPALPRAVRLTFSHPRYGPLPQLFAVGRHD